MRILLVVLVLVFAGMRPLPLLSAESADTLFQRGVDRFRAGEFELALADFEAAERQGMQSAQLIYNYGSVLYRLGDYARSQSYFELLTGEAQLAGVAYYNLALIAYRQDDINLARAMFRRVIEISTDAEMQKLAARQLEKLDSAYGETPAISREWFGLVRFDIGWDSNIELDSVEGGSEESGAYLQGLGYVETPLGALADFDWVANATLFGNSYPADKDYGYDSLAMGVTGRRDSGAWETTLGLQPDRSWLAGETFLSSTELSLAFRRDLGEGRQLSFDLRETRIAARSSAYDYLAGNQSRFGLEWRARGEIRSYRLRWRLELNDRHNAPDSDSSPTRRMLDLEIKQQMPNAALLKARFELRRSRYDDISELRRTDDRWRLEFGASQKLDGDWRIEEMLQLTENRSDQSTQDYRRTQISVSVQRSF